MIGKERSKHAAEALGGAELLVLLDVELDKISNGATPRRRWLASAGKTGCEF